MNHQNLQKGGIIHKIIKKKLENYVKPGLKLIDIRLQIEKWIYELSKSNADIYHHKSCIAFPIGLSLNNCAAHYSPFLYSTDQTIYTDQDILKIDFGIQIDGAIIDSAISITHHPELEKLKQISIEATDTGIKLSGCDARLSEIGKSIEEVITSYEISINGYNYKVKPCKDLTGHQIYNYMIHGKKAVPNIYISYYDEKMEENEVYAIETFPTTGSGILKEGIEVSHYMINYKPLKIPEEYNMKRTFQTIFDIRKTLAWHSDWLLAKMNPMAKHLKKIIRQNYITEYPPLFDINGSFVAQTEHTIRIQESGVYTYT